jgi:hypothetical protein
VSKITEKEWIEDFQEFVRSDGATVPEHISQTVLSQVRRDLSPSAWLVFAKLLGVHTITGTLSLAICNQFGINPFQTEFSLSDYFMKFGHPTCMFLCGVLFLSVSLLLCRSIILPEDLRVLRRNAWIQVFGLSMISLAVFAVVGAQLTLAIAILWLIGAMLGGTIVAFIPKKPAAHAV